MTSILEKLNPPQREAVMATEGPVLIIAGAGSGKTLALTHRVAYLILEKKVRPQSILAVTFTNKAAGEMKERIISLLDTNTRINTNDANKFAFSSLPLIGTFHSICVKILRREIEKIGYNSNFNIFDDQDQEALMKRTMKELEINFEQFKPRAFLSAISKAKNELIDSEEFFSSVGSFWEEMAGKVYLSYQKNLKKSNALDFDDILMLTVKIFQNFPSTLEKYQNYFRYIMVDEYQDTNRAQYVFVKMLSEKHKNLCVVGDDWQGIYRWRGADIQNILDFEKDYPSAKVVKLEQNYRSTQKILDAAYGVISKNINRKDKKIWTQNKEGHLLVSFEAQDEKEEANFIVQEIKKLKKENQSLSDFVVLYRTNAQSRTIEEAMLRASLPYRIIGGIKFYQRKEIKDIIAYLKLIQNFSDAVSLERIINEPKRGIGEVTLSRWVQYSKENNLNLIEAGFQISKSSQIKNSKLEAIIKFCEFIKRMSEIINNLPLSDFIQKVFSQSGYEKSISDGTEVGEMRLENAKELLTVAKKYDEITGQEAHNLFLEEVALVADTDNIDQKNEAVHLMTLHSAKGLEFEIVFIAGLEEGLLPHSRSMLNAEEMEEERRLMYVGITRAKKKVYLLFTSERNIFGSTQINMPSRFLDDVPKHLVTRSSQFETQSSELLAQKSQLEKNKTKIATSYELRATSFKDGDLVQHENFGEGRIVASQGDTITVAFKKSGLKKLSASIAPIKKIT